MMKIMMMRYPNQVFHLLKRAASSCYDTTALLGYNDQPIVCLNDVKGHEDKYGRRTWPPDMHRLFLSLTDGMPQPFAWAGRSYNPCIVAKIIINSTWDPPNDPEFTRRYSIAEQEDSWEIQK